MAYPSMHDVTSQVSEREADVLRLLATGHDTKSAANLLGVSIHAVNERLREARRKLGATSSREAARRFAAMEARVPINWDKIPGEAVSGEQGMVPLAGPTNPRRYLLGGLLMLAAVIALPLIYTAADGDAAAAPPRVVAVSPASGDTIPAGPFTLSVTFDRAMTPRSWSFVQITRATYPECSGQPVQSADRRTFSLSCIARPGRRYEL